MYRLDRLVPIQLPIWKKTLARLPLTEEQKRAATSTASRLFIEASPGSGKTTVAAERFGVLRFSPRQRSTPVVALSFTRSATAELRTRVGRRWGTSASRWPNRIETIDRFLVRLLEHLLRVGDLGWPGGHRELQVIDDWHGHSGFRPIQQGGWCRRIQVLDDGTVRTSAIRAAERRWGFSTVGGISPLLELGLATPREVREALTEAFNIAAIRTRTLEYLRATVGHLLVDEVFDANELDIRVLRAACCADVPMTLIGDPWQALYGWRGATPDLIDPFVDAEDFERTQLTRSFRYKTSDTEQMASALRAGLPVQISDASSFDIVLARKWMHLWDLGDDVLPLSFGRPQNRTHAALVLLLNVVTTSRMDMTSLFVREALAILGIEGESYWREAPAVMAPIIDQLAAGAPAAQALDAVRDAMVSVGASQRPPSGAPDKEAAYRSMLEGLARRLTVTGLVPGITVFQAKGMEWDSVAVHLPDTDMDLLAAGLDPSQDSHRVLYVALTRARLSIGRAL